MKMLKHRLTALEKDTGLDDPERHAHKQAVHAAMGHVMSDPDTFAAAEALAHMLHDDELAMDAPEVAAAAGALDRQLNQQPARPE